MTPEEKESLNVQPVRIALTGRFKGWEAQILPDGDYGFSQDMSAGDEDRVHGAIMRHVVDWNFKDVRGNPADCTSDGLRQVPLPAMLEFMKLMAEEYSRELPNVFAASASPTS